ncbi:hypothetical protein GY14_20810 [Delftia tsuruhatensis]|nr:hypothetical protein GY14_20810 [Delftia tsuruhatensis]
MDAEGFKPEDAPETWPFGKERPAPPEPEPDLSGLMPLDYLLEVMRNPKLPAPLRMQAATLAAQYCHPKPRPRAPSRKPRPSAKRTVRRASAAASRPR